MRMLAKPLFLLIPLLLGLATAQDLTADEVLERITTAAEEAEDASFLLTGHLVDPDGTEIPLEVAVELIPDLEAGRAEFYQPDALADNVIVFADGAVYNYIFLTNQVTVFDAGDPDALGGLLGGREGGEPFEMTLDLEELFAGWEASLDGYEEADGEGRYLLRLDNLEEGAAIDHVLAAVADGVWVPRSLTLYDAEGEVLADLRIEGFESDLGLAVEDVTYIPEDAEVIDERN